MAYATTLTVNGVTRAIALDDPRVTLLDLLREQLDLTGTKKGMSQALALAAYKNSELFSYSYNSLTRAVASLLDRAIAAGEIRDDISAEDLLRALVGMCYSQDQPGWQKSVLRLVDVFIDGLRLDRADGRGSERPSSRSRRF